MDARHPVLHQERLLETAPADVPQVVRNAAQEFCEARPEVEAAWVCIVEWREPGHKPERRLRFAVKFGSPIDQPDEGFAASRRLRAELSAREADLIADVGLGVLADRAVAAWEAKAERVFTRSPG